MEQIVTSNINGRTIAEYDWCEAVIRVCTCDDDEVCRCTDESLHAPSPDVADEFNDWDGDPITGATACGIGQTLSIPGPFSRMGCQRCPRCCELTGMPQGVGSPKNDEACRALLWPNGINTDAEILDQMVASDRVTTRAKGVIAKFLLDVAGIDKTAGFPMADVLIKRMTAASLATFIQDDLKTYLDSIRQSD